MDGLKSNPSFSPLNGDGNKVGTNLIEEDDISCDSSVGNDGIIIGDKSKKSPLYDGDYAYKTGLDDDLSIGSLNEETLPQDRNFGDSTKIGKPLRFAFVDGDSKRSAQEVGGSLTTTRTTIAKVREFNRS